MDFTTLAKVAYSDQLILTTEQLANFYECDKMKIIQNFNNNKNRFIEGKHYFKLEGENLKIFKRYIDQIDIPINKFAPSLYLWTKYGAARHAKMLSTDKAWEVFELLEEAYFESKEEIETAPQVKKPVAVENPVEMKLIITIALKDVKSAVEVIEELFGVKHGIALATCINVAEKHYSIDFSEVKGLLPPAKHEICQMNATQLGKFIAEEKHIEKISAQKVNQVLLEQGLQEKDENGGYRLTDKGKEYGEAMPYERNGHTGYQIKWSAAVSVFFK